MTATLGEHDNPIAIVGVAARLPGARDVREFWRNLQAGVESVEHLDPDVARLRELDPAAADAPGYRPVTATAADLDRFDPEFFGFTQREAELCDPQFRLFLELSYTALNDAGYDPRRIGQRVGVFGGATTNRYRQDYIERNRAVSRAAGLTSMSTGNNADYIAPLVSYRLGFMGPSVSLYTACSTSLVAVHQAMQALRRGECDVAVAGGVQVDLPLGGGYPYLEGGILSRDGHVRPFSADATGTIFADGGALVVLKPLAAAQADGDQVYAVLRGSAVNNDGNQRAGFTAPGVEGQLALIRAALDDARVHPDQIGMVEAHGTGTRVGDPIEVAALSAAYRERTDRREYCWLGSVKGNVGHLGPAAGTVGLLKAILAVRDGIVTPTINCTEPNPAMDLPNTPFRLAREVHEWTDPPWRDGGAPRIAAVSSFGIGGTNAHVVVQQPPVPSARAAEPAGAAVPQLWPVSARSADALAESCAALAEQLPETGHHPADVAFTLQEGRAAFAHRRLLTVTDPQAALAELTAEPTARTITGVAGTPRVTFLFPGQGAQFPGAGRELYRTWPVYRDAVDTCAEHLTPLLGFDLRDLLHADPDDEQAAARLDETAVTQPALFTVEWALARLLLSFGVEPVALLGHSIGEIVAATVAGVFELPDALTLVARRGQLMQTLPPGGMLSLSLGADAVRDMLPGELDIAASNSPSACVVSGERAAIEQFAQELADIGISGSVLRTSHAFHSRMMAPICDELTALVEGFPRQAPRVRYLSNVTGDWITDEQATSAAYWATHVRQEVRLESCLARLGELTDALHVQVGPGQSMCVFARQYAASQGRTATALTTMALPKDTASTDPVVLATTVGRLWVSGVDLDWSAVRVGSGRRVSLPGYPYERRRCWVDPDPVRPGSLDDDVEVSNDPLLTPLYLPAWRSQPVPRRDGSLLGETWLVLTDADHPVGAEIVAAARRRDVFVLPAYAGPGFVAAPDGYEFDPDRATDVDLLVEAVHEAGLLPDRIVYALFDDADDPAQVAARAYHRMAVLAKALLGTFRAEVELVAVTDRVWSVNGEPARPEGATVAGPLRTLPRELRTIRVRQVDAALTGRQVAATVVGEIAAGGDAELVALRGHRRWVHHHASIPNEPVGAARPGVGGGVLLVTGGLGGLGLAIAEDLATRQRTDFVLVGRSGLPDRELWDAPDTPEETRARVAAVRRIEATGSRVLVRAADVTDADAMAAVVDAAQAELGPITGIVHAAGLPGGQLLALHDTDAADRVLAPKVRGTLVLDALVRAGRLPELDFLALFSSIVSVSADYGHSDYAAANTFLDAYATAHADASPYVVAINWWGWQEVGMVSTDRAGEGFRTLQRLRGGSMVTALDHPLLHRASRDGDGWTFEVDLDVDGHWVLTDHRIGGVGVLPGTSLLEMAHTAARHALGARPVRLEDVVFIDPVRVTGPVTGVLTLTPAETDGFEFAISFAAAGQPATVHCRGRLRPAAQPTTTRVDVVALREGLVEADADQPYSGLVEFGPRFRAVDRYWAKGDQGLVELALPAVGHDDADRYALHPALLDRAVYGLSGVAGHSYLPFLYRSVEVYHPIPTRCFVVQTYHGDPTRPEFMEVDELVVDAEGRVCVAVEGYTLRSVSPEAAAAPARAAGGASARGTGMLTNAEGGELFRRIMTARPGPQVVTSVGSLPERLARARSFDQQTVEAAETVAEPVRTIGTTFVAPQTPVQRELARLWCESLGLTEIGIDDDFFLLGGSSLTVVQLASRIRERLSVELSAADMFEYPTIRRLAGLLDSDGVTDGIS